MNEHDFAVLAAFCVRLRCVYCAVKRLADIPPMADVRRVHAALEVLERDIAQLTEDVQQREVVSWVDPSRYPPRHPAPPRILVAKPLESRQLRRAAVKRFDVQGAEREDEPDRA